MMKVLINSFHKFPEFNKACNINILEKSKLLKSLQKKNINSKKIIWLKNLDELIKIHQFLLQMNFLMHYLLNNLLKKKITGMRGMLI